MAQISPTLLRRLRERSGVSLRQLARQADISSSYLSDIELGRRNPPEPTLRRLLEGLEELTQEQAS